MLGKYRRLFREVFARPVASKAKPSRKRFVPRLTALDDRAVPAVITHTSTFTGDATGTLVVTVDDAKPGYEDRLFWNYHFTNGSLGDPTYDPYTGPTTFIVGFSRLLTEDPLDQGTSDISYTEKGTRVGPDGAYWDNGDKFHGLNIGASADFWFTTTNDVYVRPATAWTWNDALGMYMSAATIGPRMKPHVGVVGFLAADEEGDTPDTVTPGKFILYRTGDLDEALTVYVSFDGDGSYADEGYDFEADDEVTFGIGENTAYIDVDPIKDDWDEEGDELIRMTIDPDDDYVVDAYETEPDDGSGGGGGDGDENNDEDDYGDGYDGWDGTQPLAPNQMIVYNNPNLVWIESGPDLLVETNQAHVLIRRTGGLYNTPITVNVHLTPEGLAGAVWPDDYTVSGTDDDPVSDGQRGVVFRLTLNTPFVDPSGLKGTERSFLVTIKLDRLIEDDETFRITLSPDTPPTGNSPRYKPAPYQTTFINTVIADASRIQPAANQKGVNGDVVPSIQAQGGKHYVSPKKAGEFVILEAVLKPGENFAAMYEWVGGEAVPGGAAEQRRVSRAATGKFVVYLKSKANGEIVDTFNVWIVWAGIAGTKKHDIRVSTALGNSAIGIGVGWSFVATIEPAEMFDKTADVPDFRGGGVSGFAPDAPGRGLKDPLYGLDLGNGTGVEKIDFSRKVRTRVKSPVLYPGHGLDPVGGVLLDGLPNPNRIAADYPTDDLVGNDDMNAGDEGSGLYTGNAGSRDNITNPKTNFIPPLEKNQISQYDYPEPYIKDKSAGVEGTTFEVHMQFKEFVRIAIGSKWYRLSDDFLWRFDAKFKKASVNGVVDWGNDGSVSDDTNNGWDS